MITSPTDTRNPIPDTHPNFSTMLNQAAAALADCMLNLTESTSQAASGHVNPVKLKASKAIYMSAQAALMQSRAVEASLRALAHFQKIQASYKPPEEPRDYEAEARMVEMWALADDADRTARINARVRLAAEAKYANAKTDAEIDALGKQLLKVPEEDELEEVNEATPTEGGHSCPPQSALNCEPQTSDFPPQTSTLPASPSDSSEPSDPSEMSSQPSPFSNDDGDDEEEPLNMTEHLLAQNPFPIPGNQRSKTLGELSLAAKKFPRPSA